LESDVNLVIPGHDAGVFTKFPKGAKVVVKIEVRKYQRYCRYQQYDKSGH
jgi:glycogen synthase